MSNEEREKAEGRLQPLLKELRDLEDHHKGHFGVDMVGGIVRCIQASVDTASLKALNTELQSWIKVIQERSFRERVGLFKGAGSFGSSRPDDGEAILWMANRGGLKVRAVIHPGHPKSGPKTPAIK